MAVKIATCLSALPGALLWGVLAFASSLGVGGRWQHLQLDGYYSALHV